MLSAQSKPGEPLGLVNEQLTPCPDKPNCICSEYKNDTAHYTKPIIYKQSDLKLISSIITDMGGQVQIQTEHYIAATFTSALFGFVDDLEARLDQNKQLLHIRSASRVGHSDFGVNKKRLEHFKKIYAEKLRLKGD